MGSSLTIVAGEFLCLILFSYLIGKLPPKSLMRKDVWIHFWRYPARVCQGKNGILEVVLDESSTKELFIKV